MKKLLLTGFEPFDNAIINPSWEAVKLLPNEIEDTTIIKMQLPVVFGTAADQVIAKIQEEMPDYVIMLGLAGNRTKVTPEVIAINLADARIPDNAGNQPKWKKISEDGQDGIFSMLPVKDMVEKLNNEGIPAELSYSAGTYVCNDLFYRVLDFIDKKHLSTEAGFIHVPMPKDTDSTSKSDLTLDKIVRGITVCIETL